MEIGYYIASAGLFALGLIIGYKLGHGTATVKANKARAIGESKAINTRDYVETNNADLSDDDINSKLRGD